MRKVFEYLPIVCHMVTKHRLAVVLISAPEDMMMRASDHLDRVKLYKAQFVDELSQVQFTYRSSCEPLST